MGLHYVAKDSSAENGVRKWRKVDARKKTSSEV